MSACTGAGPASLARPPRSPERARLVEPKRQPVLVRSDYSKGDVASLCHDAIEDTRARLDAIAAIPAEKRTLDNTLLDYETTLADLSDRTTPLTFMGYVSPIADVNAEGSDCEASVGEFVVDVSTRKDLYDALKDAKPRTSDEARLLSETLKGFEANGLELPAEKLAQMKELKTRLTGLEAEFSSNLNGDASRIELTPEELDGVPASYVGSLKPAADGSHLVVGARESDTIVLSTAKNAETRRKWLTAYYNRQGEQNTALLEQAIGLRQRIAALMGYTTWADYRTHGRMARDAKTVNSFLAGLKDKLKSREASDLDRLLSFKKELDPNAARVEAWDINYLAEQVKKRDYSLDTETIREYFPADLVISALFDAYSKILGVKFEKVADAKVWSPDVGLYRIENAADGRLIGFFYADLVPRQGKYGHAAAFPLISGRVLPDGEYSYPVASIVANLAPPTADRPSLLSHDDVETLFHEFGHIMHQTLTRAPYASLSGTAVAQDFVEAPSQMLENWVWDSSILESISGHYLDHSKKLPEELRRKMVEAKDFNSGYYYMRQLMLATLDMTYHSTEGAVDSVAIYDKLYRDMLGVEPVAGGHFSASFGHLMGGYDAGYYGYLWSEVYAQDMFTRFEKDGLLNGDVGGAYRRAILESGGMRDALDLLRDFLGREPNSDAFFRKLGI